MTRLDFVLHRVAFSGLPYGEVRSIQERVSAGRSWPDACLESADKMQLLNENACACASPASRFETSRWLASALHAATLLAHDTSGGVSSDGILDLRSRARQAYQQACTSAPASIEPVAIDVGPMRIHGYLRIPATRPKGVVLLFNGLDSLAEVELHAFSDVLLSRDLATLALDLPGNFASQPRAPLVEVERVASGIVSFIRRYPVLSDCPVGAFGVSFGGHLVCRMLTTEHVVAGVAVSPPAFLGKQEFAFARIQSMFRLAVCPSGEDLDAAASAVSLSELPAPRGSLLLVETLRDEIFGAEHSDSIAARFGDRATRLTFDAEHVGTSLVHQWLPQACDWLAKSLGTSRPLQVERKF